MAHTRKAHRKAHRKAERKSHKSSRKNQTGGSRKVQKGGSRKNQAGGKRSAWLQKVMKTYKALKAKNPKATLTDAMKAAKKA